MRSLLALRPAELRDAFAADGLAPYRADQVVRWIWKRGERDLGAMSNLPRRQRAALGRGWRTRELELHEDRPSRDGARKLVLLARDASRIETVLIPEADRHTVCVSSQVGCGLGCPFCATGAAGLRRNLRAEEIVDQVLHAGARLAPAGERLTHVVFMGMGEPLVNVRAVVQAIRVLTDPATLGLAGRRITVSTAGVVPGIERLGREVRVPLAVSLHAATDALRDRLVPLNRRWPLDRLLEACRAYPLPPRERISFEYVLLRGVNDSAAEARALVRRLHGVRAKLNLIPLNEHPASPFRAPAEATVERFAAILARARVPVAVRRSRGDDIAAACGQLGAPAEERAAQSSPAIFR